MNYKLPDGRTRILVAVIMVQHTVTSLAHICSSLISTIIPELILMQSHTAKHRQIHRKENSIVFLDLS